MDFNAGLVLNELTELQLEDKTIVVRSGLLVIDVSILRDPVHKQS